MAGNYADPVAHRFAWDQDGTHFLRINLSNNTIANDYGVGQAVHAALNSESTASGLSLTHDASQTYALAMVFPEMRWIHRILYAWNLNENASSFTLETSQDSTNGLDGTWTARSTFDPVSNTLAGFRSLGHDPQLLTEVKAIRFRFTTNTSGSGRHYLSVLHLFGTFAGVDDRLLLWHPTLDEILPPAWLDWGDVGRGTPAQTRSIRVKNQSDEFTADDVTLTTQVPTDATPSFASMIDYSADAGATWADPINIGTLAPGAISPEILVRFTPDPSAALSLRWWRTLLSSTAPGA